MNEKLIYEVLRMLEERSAYYETKSGTKQSEFYEGVFCGKAGAYGSAVHMLRYALAGNEECLKEFDYFGA